MLLEKLIKVFSSIQKRIQLSEQPLTVDHVLKQFEEDKEVIIQSNDQYWGTWRECHVIMRARLLQAENKNL